MANCQACGSFIRNDSRFCANCGARNIPENIQICHSCGGRLQQQEGFCALCGAPLPGLRPSIQAAEAHCGHCGALIQSNMQFCPVCGKMARQNDRQCPSCGLALQDGYLFCASCGTVVAGGKARAAHQAPTRHHHGCSHHPGPQQSGGPHLQSNHTQQPPAYREPLVINVNPAPYAQPMENSFGRPYDQGLFGMSAAQNQQNTGYSSSFDNGNAPAGPTNPPQPMYLQPTPPPYQQQGGYQAVQQQMPSAQQQQMQQQMQQPQTQINGNGQGGYPQQQAQPFQQPPSAGGQPGQPYLPFGVNGQAPPVQQQQMQQPQTQINGNGQMGYPQQQAQPFQQPQQPFPPGAQLNQQQFPPPVGTGQIAPQGPPQLQAIPPVPQPPGPGGGLPAGLPGGQSYQQTAGGQPQNQGYPPLNTGASQYAQLQPVPGQGAPHVPQGVALPQLGLAGGGLPAPGIQGSPQVNSGLPPPAVQQAQPGAVQQPKPAAPPANGYQPAPGQGLQPPGQPPPPGGAGAVPGMGRQPQAGGIGAAPGNPPTGAPQQQPAGAVQQPKPPAATNVVPYPAAGSPAGASGPPPKADPPKPPDSLDLMGNSAPSNPAPSAQPAPPTPPQKAAAPPASVSPPPDVYVGLTTKCPRCKSECPSGQNTCNVCGKSLVQSLSMDWGMDELDKDLDQQIGKGGKKKKPKFFAMLALVIMTVSILAWQFTDESSFLHGLLFRGSETSRTEVLVETDPSSGGDDPPNDDLIQIPDGQVPKSPSIAIFEPVDTD